MSEDKVIEKIEFLRSCAGVYAAKIGTSSIKRLMQFDIQPIIVNKGFPIIDLLNEVSLGLTYGGLSWVDRAVQNAKVLAPLHVKGDSTCIQQVRHNLISSVDDLT
jgi:nitrogen fixation protein NifX